ncbi:hypothetical protein A2348_02335 [Candidatus Uhrbacteria bacterium RIFOXYB12_FULL_58_10]|uniref:RNA polymerase sigma-70 region 2 domain-containing protein n=1 Tax=Candidatus Uhrbacteria bacterium RIFOXYB2_FULL_57_15 TaxID=1802422 RepID=A0A1F7WAJ3_9BACT|nr:MAG: hypothetical protein A2348_02335 [Candidatus Uhrbacteria bacterium RIFOXYB12_FULL_58_10]OGL99077.1 MAG: hypothetical protein A2501_02890 [Candidatus Uhrbacteria bacterium RIFOXYC12_FULL_57_11]OGL99616.1 MAG: hypothetical protein A2304_04410 [Candidatus Uhrbacteria bacterium RIFOXYB2_FULL_57_15]
MDQNEKQRQFTREYRQLFDFLYRYVRYRVPSVEDAEDVVSDVFVQAYARLDGYEPLLGTFRQ